ncbi:hypothetical protein ACLOJK_022592 [Asimina triloba]
MSTVLAFRFLPRGGFSLSDHRSFDPTIPHRFIHVPASKAWRMYRHFDYYLITIRLAAGENWSTLSTAATTPHPSCRAISAIPAASPAPRRHHKDTFTPTAAITAPRPSHKVTPTAMVVTPTSAIRPPCKAAVSTIPAASPTPRRRRKNVFANVAASPTPQPSRKGSSIVVITTLTPASRPLREAIIATTTSASRSA